MRNIIKGDTFKRSYTFYNPLSSNKKLPDKTSPVDLSGIDISFIFEQTSDIFIFTAESGNLIVTPLLGNVEIIISPIDTDKFTALSDSASYLLFTYSPSQIYTKAKRREIVISRK